METKITSSVKVTPKADKNEWEASAGVISGGHNLGPVVANVGLTFNTNHSSEHEVEIHENLVYEKDFNIASRTVVSVGDKKISEAQGLLAWKNQEWGQVWFRSNCLANFMGLGW